MMNSVMVSVMYFVLSLMVLFFCIFYQGFILARDSSGSGFVYA